MKDLAGDSFVSKIHPFFRWLLFLPAAIVVPILFYGIQKLFYTWFMGMGEGGVFIQIMGDFIIGAGFVFVGSAVAPKSQFLISIIMVVLLTLLSLASFTGALLSRSFFSSIIHPLIALGSGIYTVYTIHKTLLEENTTTLKSI